MLTRVFRFLLCGACVVTFSFCAVAQKASVKRNVILRAEVSSASAAEETLHRGDTLTILDSSLQAAFYHVKAADGNEGWVWSRNVEVSASSLAAGIAPTTTVHNQDSTSECDADLWNHVYNPQRLIVKQQCIVVTGTIVDATNGVRHDGVRHEADGDTHGWLKLVPQFSNLLNAGNMSNEGGNLVFEIASRFHVTQQDAIASCPTSYHSPVQIPSVGSHVRIIGSFVQDSNYSRWMEVHPVTSITIIP